ncbi:MAG: hypothetical protein D6785_07695, partial [Planctomycetota bacterium]
MKRPHTQLFITFPILTFPKKEVNRKTQGEGLDKDKVYIGTNCQVKTDGKDNSVVLEDFAFTPDENKKDAVEKLATWLAN